MKEQKITWKTLHDGQMRLCADSVYEYEIFTDLRESSVKEFCTKFLRPSKIEFAGCFNGSCSFPHGLNSYFKFTKKDDNKYYYIVCEPYTG